MRGTPQREATPLRAEIFSNGRNEILHQILSDCHLHTFLKTKKKGWSTSIYISI